MAKKSSVKVRLVPEKKVDSPFYYYVKKPTKGAKAKIKLKETTAEINLEENETGVSPGQACVFYSKNKFGDKVLGGGWIDRTTNNNLST